MSSDSSTPSDKSLASASGLKLVDPAMDSGDELAAGDSATPSPTLAPTETPIPVEGGEGEGESDSRRVPLWLLVVTLLIGIVVIGWQAQLASELEAEVAGLERQLDRSQAVVEAQRAHLGEIRGGVYELSDQLDGLRALIDAGPRRLVPSTDSTVSAAATSAGPTATPTAAPTP